MLDYVNHLTGMWNASIFSRILEEDGQGVLYFLLAIATLISLGIHEFGHAWMADKLGDSGPRKAGRLTIAPWAHIDPLGMLLIIASTLIGFPVGWGKPVKTDPETYKVDRKVGVALVAVAGPLMNLVAAFALAIPARLMFTLLQEQGPNMEPWMVFSLAITFLLSIMVMLVSISLFTFNLLPLYPLDGSHILANLLPNDIAVVYVRLMKRYGMYLFLGLLGSGVLGNLVQPIIIGLFRFLLGI